jgi:DNA processing protein
LPEDSVQNHTTQKQLSLPPEELAVYNVLSPYPEHIDNIIRKTHIESGKLLSLLLQLELKGIVHQLPGKYFAIFEDKTA